jgi:GT2 family glycosyltransferase
MDTCKRIAIVSASAQDHSVTTPIEASYEKLQKLYGGTIELFQFKGNSKGIPEVYNSQISELSTRFDYIMFVHDDVLIQDAFLGGKLYTAHEDCGFDVVGVAGSKDLDFKRNQVWAWHTLSAPISWSGCVGHYVDEEKSKIRYNSFGPTPQRCIVLDGLLLSCRAQIFRNPEVRFDERFKFDFYDMSFCINAHLHGLKLGTIDISCVHGSQGAGINEPKYAEAQKVFTEHWLPRLKNLA